MSSLFSLSPPSISGYRCRISMTHKSKTLFFIKHCSHPSHRVFGFDHVVHGGPHECSDDRNNRTPRGWAASCAATARSILACASFFFFVDLRSFFFFLEFLISRNSFLESIRVNVSLFFASPPRDARGGGSDGQDQQRTNGWFLQSVFVLHLFSLPRFHAIHALARPCTTPPPPSRR